MRFKKSRVTSSIKINWPVTVPILEASDFERKIGGLLSPVMNDWEIPGSAVHTSFHTCLLYWVRKSFGDSHAQIVVKRALLEHSIRAGKPKKMGLKYWADMQTDVVKAQLWKQTMKEIGYETVGES